MNFANIELIIELIEVFMKRTNKDQESIKRFYWKNVSQSQISIELLSVKTVIKLQRLAQKLGDRKLIAKIQAKLGQPLANQEGNDQSGT